MVDAVVVNIRDGARHDVRIDRRTRWGNPFVLGRDGTRAEVIALFERDLRRRVRCGEVTAAALAELDGKRLGCWCSPLPCHGDVLARYARRARLHLEREGQRPPADP